MDARVAVSDSDEEPAACFSLGLPPLVLHRKCLQAPKRYYTFNSGTKNAFGSSRSGVTSPS